MRSPPNGNTAVRRFATVWTVSLAVKVVALAVLVFLVLKILGGT